MIVKLLTEHHLEFLSLNGGCRGSSESTLVKYHIVGNLMHWLKRLLTNAGQVLGEQDLPPHLQQLPGCLPQMGVGVPVDEG